MKKMSMFALILLMSLLKICNSTDSKIYFENELQMEENKANKEPLSLAITRLALKLDGSISSQDPTENVVFSPLSIEAVLGLMLLGAKGNTALELAQFLGVDSKARMNLDYRLKTLHENFGNLLSRLVSKSNNGYEISTATGVFPDKNRNVQQNYLNLAKNIYKSEIQPLDYQLRNIDAMKIINKWVANKTENRIKSILDQPPITSTSVIIANALYFNGNWKIPFNPLSTKRKPFYVGKGTGRKEETIEVDLMIGTGNRPHIENERFQMLGLPYVGQEVYMYIILPENIDMFMKNLNENDLHLLVNLANGNISPVIYAIPKMKLDNEIELENILRSIGMTTTFNSSQADFSNIGDGVIIDQIKHKVELDINEIGTKASAATSGLPFRMGGTPVIRADRPFLFFIYHNPSNTILFWGKIMKPTPNYPVGGAKVGRKIVQKGQRKL